MSNWSEPIQFIIDPTTGNNSFTFTPSPSPNGPLFNPSCLINYRFIVVGAGGYNGGNATFGSGGVVSATYNNISSDTGLYINIGGTGGYNCGGGLTQVISNDQFSNNTPYTTGCTSAAEWTQSINVIAGGGGGGNGDETHNGGNACYNNTKAGDRKSVV